MAAPSVQQQPLPISIATPSRDCSTFTSTKGLLNGPGQNNCFLNSAVQLGYLFRARTCFSPSNLLTLYKAQIRPNQEYCSHIGAAAAPTTLSILYAVQKRAIRLIGDPVLKCHLQPLSHRRAVGDLSLFCQYSNGFCSAELTSIIL
nr:unnamed protein product [Callosobruchus chinensis]